MASWHERRDVDLALRAGGLLLIAMAHGLAWLLTHDVHSHAGRAATPFDLLLAAALFVAASAGTALLVVVRHLFDEIRVAARWARPTAIASQFEEVPPAKDLGRRGNAPAPSSPEDSE